MKKLTRQVIVRLDEALYLALQRDADENGRTVSQTIRYLLRALIEPPAEN